MIELTPNIVWHRAKVTRERRGAQNRHKSCVLWFTGLSGAGKSTLVHDVEEQLHHWAAAPLCWMAITAVMAFHLILAFPKATAEKTFALLVQRSS
jgi:hypothetical protein